LKKLWWKSKRNHQPRRREENKMQIEAMKREKTGVSGGNPKKARDHRTPPYTAEKTSARWCPRRHIPWVDKFMQCALGDRTTKTSGYDE